MLVQLPQWPAQFQKSHSPAPSARRTLPPAGERRKLAPSFVTSACHPIRRRSWRLSTPVVLRQPSLRHSNRSRRLSSASSSRQPLPPALKPPHPPLPPCRKVMCWCRSSTSRPELTCSTDLCTTPLLNRSVQNAVVDDAVVMCNHFPFNIVLMSIFTRTNTSSPRVSAQSQLSHSIQSAVSARGIAHTFTSSQLQNAATAAALGSRSGKHAAALSLQHGAKISAGSSSNQANMAAWRKQSAGNAGK